MSIASEIERLQGAKANIKTAIESKGVTVGDGKINTYADLISQISVGGGSGDYEQGFEDGKNSVVDLGKLCWKLHLNNLNIFGKSEVVLDLDNVTSLNGFYCLLNNGGVANTTVEKLTINCKKPITDMYKAFNGEIAFSDKTLKTLVLNIDTSKNTSLTNGFVGMQALETITSDDFNGDGIGDYPLDFTSCTALNQPFRNCTALKELRIKPNTIKINFGIQYSPNLSTDTIQSIIDGLANLTGGTAQTLTLHKDVGDKLTDTQKATITAKNWTLVY